MQSLPLFPFFTEMHCDTHQENLLKNHQGIRWLQFPTRLSSLSMPNVHNRYYLHKITLYPLQNQKMLKIESEDKEQRDFTARLTKSANCSAIARLFKYLPKITHTTQPSFYRPDGVLFSF
jgi:hypothetical protein